MRKTLLILFLFFGLINNAAADHVKGGFFSYKYLGPGVNDPINNERYQVTLTLYVICTVSPNQLAPPVNFTIFNAGNLQVVQNPNAPMINRFDLGKVTDEPCISGDQTGCFYTVIIYSIPSIELPKTTNGYIIAYQRCCRIAGIQNIAGSSNSIGNTFMINIPGTAVGLNAVTNSSPVFPINDTAVICGGSHFQYSFQASDPDPQDSLSYQFCNAFQGGDNGANSAPAQAATPPYLSIPYQGPFSGSQPMGSGVTIHPVTGLISGLAPSTLGEYVICVCVSEWRSGTLIGVTRKELHIQVKDCVPIEVNLPLDAITCDGFSWNFFNSGDQSLINTYHWNFGDPGSGTNDSSDLSNPTHVFSDTGVYTIKLIVNRGEQCTDTGFTVLKVYPGFFPGFTSTGTCINFPIQFNDTTNTVYGVVNTWSWNFGDLTTVADTSHNQNPSWLFATPGPKDVSLIVTNSKGCKDTATVVVQVLDKPPISVAPADTLICRNDAVQLHATGTGVFSWTPPVNIINANTPDPTVSPTSSTWYYVTLNENGCINRDSAHVRVISTVTVVANNDTTICRGDPAFLGANTDGLQYLWSPAATLDNPTLLNPTATPLVTTTYVLRSTVGGCSNIDSMTVKVVPYPGSNAGPNQIICYNGTAQLNGGIVGSSFTWIPASYLNNPNILNPLSTPPRTTDYILTVFDTLGCPKPGRDTITVTVLPKIRPFAGRDTIVIVGQPLQFNGSGGTSYQWIPSTGLSNPTIPNPIGTYGAEIDSIRYTLIVSDAAGCSDSAFVKVRVFKTAAYVFVPTAFTPNNDGLNDVIRPIAVGIQKINYFSIYNRWGQLVFTTTTNGHGWDGNIRGTPQGTSTFVWMVSAIDYKGAPIFLKGHTTLIR